jgi:hypothetical protein
VAEDRVWGISRNRDGREAEVPLGFQKREGGHVINAFGNHTSFVYIIRRPNQINQALLTIGPDTQLDFTSFYTPTSQPFCSVFQHLQLLIRVAIFNKIKYQIIFPLATRLRQHVARHGYFLCAPATRGKQSSHRTHESNAYIHTDSRRD